MTIQQQFTCWLETIPEKYRGIIPSKLAPSEKSRLPMEEQAKLYDEIRANPLSGWAFFAPAGYSKTTCSWALHKLAYAENLKKCAALPMGGEWHIQQPGEPHWHRCYVWRKSVPDLLAQQFACMDDRKAPKPDVSVEKIEKAVRDKITPRLFLEEIDKIKPSEYAINQLFRIFDVIDRHKGQLVLDTNLSKKQFMDIFGEPIVRRIKENCIVKEYGF